MMEKNTLSEETKNEMQASPQSETSTDKTIDEQKPNDILENDNTLNDNAPNTGKKHVSSNQNQTNADNTNTPDASSEENLKEKIQEMEQQLSELNEKHIRLLAEFDNFRKRTRKEKEELLKYAGENVWKSILPIIDDFERAIKENNNTNDIETIKKGFELIYNKIKHIIQQNNITPIDSLHKDFNPDIMEAMAKVPAPSEELKGKVIEEMEKAYQMNDKIIRFAKVIVAE